MQVVDRFVFPYEKAHRIIASSAFLSGVTIGNRKRANWEHGRVFAVLDDGESHYKTDDILEILSFGQSDMTSSYSLGYVQVTEIMMVIRGQLSDDQLQELGYKTREAFDQIYNVSDSAYFWFTRFRRVSDK